MKVIINEIEIPEVSADVQIDPYKGFAEFPTTVSKITCQICEPNFINPNGYDKALFKALELGLV